ncbi:MAG: glutaredoxin family protein [Pseudomonadota bacterium]
MNENMRIRLYTLSTCVHCKALRDFFAKRELPFEYVDVDLLQGQERKEMLKEVRQFNARCSFPTSVIGDRVIVGFREDELQKVLDFSSDSQKDE